MESAFWSMIWDTIRTFTKDNDVNVPPLNYPMPSLFQLDHKDRPEIMTLPVYDLNEGIINEMIQIIYKIQGDIGLSSEQVQHNVISFNGDFMTVRNDRYTRTYNRLTAHQTRGISSVQMFF